MKKFLLIASFVFFISENSFPQPKEEWVNRFNGSGNSFDISSKLLIDKFNNIIVSGTSSQSGSLLDFLIVKYSQDGNVIWSKTIDGGNNSFDQLNSACLDNSGNCIVTGYTTDSGFETHFTTVKIDSSGNVVWTRIFDAAGFTNGSGKDVSADISGNIFTTGIVKDSNGYFDIVTIKYSGAGNFQWSQFFNGDGNGDDIPVSVTTDNANNILIAATSKSLSGNADMTIVKYSPAGSFIWKKTFNGPANTDDEMSSMITDIENNIYFCGGAYNSPGAFDYFFAKLNSQGLEQWSHFYNGPGNNFDIASSITLDTMNNVYVTGSSRNDTVLGSEDITTIKVSQNGAIDWIKIFNGEADGTDQGNSIIADEKGNVYIGGASDLEDFHMIYVLLKYDASGNFLWKKNYHYSETPEDFIYNVKLDKLDNIFVMGIGFDIATDFDIVTIKYSQTVGISENQANPVKYSLSQNYPNPFNPVTVIRYSLLVPRFISIKVYDVLGNEVTTLVNEKQNAGKYSIEFDGSGFPSGVYYYKLDCGDFSEVRKMALIK